MISQSSSSQPCAPVLLLVEDDLKLSGELSSIAQGNGWKVLPARTIERAISLAELHKSEIQLALVDVMIPATERDREQMDIFLGRRRDLARKLIHRQNPVEPPAETLADVYKELDDLDFNIQNLIAIDGGIEFLEQAKAGDFLRGWKIAICTARSNLETSNSKRFPFSETGDNWLGIYPKPITVERLLDILAKAAPARKG